MELQANGSKEIPSIHTAAVPEVLRRAKEDLAHLMRERADVMKRIGTIKQLIAGLANLFGNEILSDDLLVQLNRKGRVRPRGFTAVCRQVLMQSPQPQSAREVCEQIRLRSPLVLERHKDPLSSVTTVLHRLAAYGEARTMVRADGQRAWVWEAEGGETRLDESKLMGT